LLICHNSEAGNIKKARRKTTRESPVAKYRVNRQIRVPKVRLVGIEGEYNNQIVSFQDAMRIAQEAGLDLVEVAPNSDPPVCRVMDYGKFAYEKTRKEREARKNQKKIETKTIKLQPKIAQFHRDIRVKAARKWLEEGKKVKVAVRFHGREIQYPEIGRELILGVATELQDIAIVEQQPNMEGWSMVLLLAPNNEGGSSSSSSSASKSIPVLDDLDDFDDDELDDLDDLDESDIDED
jgi:translation initiation factor IF-3